MSSLAEGAPKKSKVIVAAVVCAAMRAQLRRAARQEVTILDCSEDNLLECVLSTTISAVFIQPTATPETMAEVVRSIHQTRPSIRIIIYSRLDPASARALVPLIKAGAHEVILRGYDDLAAWFRKGLAEEDVSTAPDSLFDQISPALPQVLLPFLSYCLRHAQEPPRVAASARALGVHRRTLVNRLAGAGLPSPRVMISWIRLLVALEKLEGTRDSVEEVAHAMQFGSAAGLRKMCKRYTGCTPTELASVEGSRTGVLLFLRRLAKQQQQRHNTPGDISVVDGPSVSRQAGRLGAHTVHGSSQAGLEAALPKRDRWGQSHARKRAVG